MEGRRYKTSGEKNVRWIEAGQGRQRGVTEMKGTKRNGKWRNMQGRKKSRGGEAVRCGARDVAKKRGLSLRRQRGFLREGRRLGGMMQEAEVRMKR